MDASYAFPKLHNAMWPGLVGKGPDSEPPIGLDTMLDLTQAAEVEASNSMASICSFPCPIQISIQPMTI